MEGGYLSECHHYVKAVIRFKLAGSYRQIRKEKRKRGKNIPSSHIHPFPGLSIVTSFYQHKVKTSFIRKPR